MRARRTVFEFACFTALSVTTLAATSCNSDNTSGQNASAGGSAPFGGGPGAGGALSAGAGPVGSGGTTGMPTGGAQSAGGAVGSAGTIGSAGTLGGGGVIGGGGTTSTAGATGMAGSAGAPGGAAGSAGAPSGGTAGVGGAGNGGQGGDGGGTGRPYVDPGTGPWTVVPKSDVKTVCKLDPDKLTAAETAFNHPWIVVRYGKLCWDHGGAGFAPSEAWSTTKTLGATVAGMVNYQTRMIQRTGKKTGQFSDEDDALQWLDSVTYNQKAKVGHVLGMVAHDANLAWGSKSFAYDTVGTTEINSISDMMNAAIAQDTARLGANVEEFTKKFLYAKLGMTKSTWSSGAATKVLAYTWSTDLYDMARVGLLLLNKGVWAGERLLSEDWIYRMTHPSFEDANTGFGYLTWLNASSNWCSIDGAKKQGPNTPGTCAPVSIHKTYPHGISEAKDCNYSAPYTCAQKYDVGVFQAVGLGGQLIQVHPALDLVIVARNVQPGGLGPGTEHDTWEALKGAVIAADPTYKGDETSFCKDYGSNNYAPDLH